MHQEQPHFDQPIVTWAVTGATLGAVIVLAAAAALIVLTDSDMELMAVAGLAAGFGGTGFGAMMGAILASLRGPAVELVSAREPGAEGRRQATSS